MAFHLSYGFIEPLLLSVLGVLCFSQGGSNLSPASTSKQLPTHQAGKLKLSDITSILMYHIGSLFIGGRFMQSMSVSG